MPITDTALSAMETRLAEFIAERRMITNEAKKRGRKTLDDAQDIDFRRLSADIADLREAIDAAKEDRARGADLRNAAEQFSNASQGRNGQQMTTQYRAESRVYNETTAQQGRSFWRDLVLHRTGDDATGEARARLNEHAQEQRTGLTTTGDGASFSPPVYLESMWVEAAVAGKPFIASIPEYPAPRGHTVEIPKITAPGTVGVQNPELTTVTNTDQTDEFLSTVLTTIAGQHRVPTAPGPVRVA
jgi:hypothetical protein